MKEDILRFIIVCLVLPFFILDVRATYEKWLKQIKIGGGLVGGGVALISLLKIIFNASIDIAEVIGWSLVCLGSIILLRAFIMSWLSSSKAKRNINNRLSESMPSVDNAKTLLVVQTEEEGFDVIREFSKRRRNQIIATVLYVGVCLSVLMLVDYGTTFLLGLSPIVWTSMFLVLVGGMIFLLLKNWRCPACSKNLRNGFNPAKCPNCGTQFTEIR